MRFAGHVIAVAGLCIVIQPVAGQPLDKQKEEERLRQYVAARPGLGDPAPDFILGDLDGKRVRLNDLLRKTPIVIEFCSYT